MDQKAAGQDLKKLEARKLEIATKIAELRLEARRVDTQLHSAGGSSVLISCW